MSLWFAENVADGENKLEKPTTIILPDDTINFMGDETPAKTAEDPPLPEPGTEDVELGCADAKPVVNRADNEEKLLNGSEDLENLDSEADDKDLSEGSDIDEYLEQYRRRYEDMEPRINLAPKRVKQSY